MSHTDIHDLLNKLKQDEDYVSKLSIDEAKELLEKVNPYGVPLSAGKESYANLSVINMKEEHIKRLAITAMVGFMYQVQREFEPDYEIDMVEKQFEADRKALIDTRGADQAQLDAKIEALRAAADEKICVLKKTSQNIIKRFLDRHLKFDVNYHVRSAQLDKNYNFLANTKEDLQKIAARSGQVQRAVESRQEQTFNMVKSYALAAHRVLSETMRVVNGMDELMKYMGSQLEALSEYVDTLDASATKIGKLQSELAKLAAPMSLGELEPALCNDPPVELGESYNRYFENNYEELRKVCSALYGFDYDFENAIINYGSHGTEDEAMQWRRAHESQIKFPVVCVPNSKVVLLGPFRENRLKAELYSKNDVVLRGMMEQMEIDQKLQKDLLKKRVEREKRRDIRINGPDDEKLGEYNKDIKTLTSNPGSKVLTKQDYKSLLEREKNYTGPDTEINIEPVADVLAAVNVPADGQRAMKRPKQNVPDDYDSDADVPDDAIQTNVFYTETDANDNQVFKKTKLYTEAEIPLHMQEGSEFADKYQPSKKEGVKYYQKEIVSKDGQKRKILSVKKEENAE